jgi:hypothetical protein
MGTDTTRGAIWASTCKAGNKTTQR